MYTNATNLEGRLGTTLTSSQSTYYNSTLGVAIDKYIDKYTETTFDSDNIITVYVDGTDTKSLVLPTMHDITAISLVADDGTETALLGTDYVLFPRGSDNKYAVRRLTGKWTIGIENYKITGKLGFKGVPEDITLVATELAANNLLSTNNTGISSERVGDWSVTYSNMDKGLSDNSKDILSKYNRLSRNM